MIKRGQAKVIKTEHSQVTNKVNEKKIAITNKENDFYIT